MSVLGVAVFACHSWSILGFLNKLSSFILHFTIAAISEIFAFMMAFALLESLAVTGFLVLLSILLPVGWLRDGFAHKGFVMILVAVIASLTFQKLMPDEFPSPLLFGSVCVIPFILLGLLLVALHVRPKFQAIVLNIQDRMGIMLYVYVPLGLISFLFVMIRYLS